MTDNARYGHKGKNSNYPPTCSHLPDLSWSFTAPLNLLIPPFPLPSISTLLFLWLFFFALVVRTSWLFPKFGIQRVMWCVSLGDHCASFGAFDWALRGLHLGRQALHVLQSSANVDVHLSNTKNHENSPAVRVPCSSRSRNGAIFAHILSSGSL